jgi:hypothetical protein
MTRFTFALMAAVVSAHTLLAQGPAPRTAPAAPAAVPSAAKQIAAAVLPLPEELRADAAVLGYGADGRLTSLRAGTNHMLCLADDPREAGFHAACYHDTLEPFMARGRALRAQGMTNTEAIDSVRFADVAAGRIRMPTVASLYSLTGDSTSWDSTTNQVREGRALYVVYVPGATEASTGLSSHPRAGMPWIMAPGTPRAHIMYFQGR